MMALAHIIPTSLAPRLIGPEELTARQIELLRMVGMYQNIKRLNGGWGLYGQPERFSEKLVKAMLDKRIVTKKLHHGRWHLEINGNGKTTLAILDERTRNRT